MNGDTTPGARVCGVDNCRGGLLPLSLQGRPYVPAFLRDVGYHGVPFNSRADEISNMKCYDILGDASENLSRDVERVDLFRPSGEVPGAPDETLRTGTAFPGCNA